MEQDVLGCFSPLSVVWFISVFSLPARGLEEGALPCAQDLASLYHTVNGNIGLSGCPDLLLGLEGIFGSSLVLFLSASEIP